MEKMLANLKMNKQLLIASAFVCVFGVQTAQACSVISTLPAKISSSGSYCLQENLSFGHTSVDAIVIDASDVELDFNGHTIRGPHADEPIAQGGKYAVVSGRKHDNILIKNGTIKGFTHGIRFGSFNSNTTVKDMNIIDSVVSGISAGSGKGITLLNNKIVMNANVFTGVYPTPIGISAGGQQLSIKGNDISFIVNYYRPQYTEPKGISLHSASVGLVADNIIMGGSYYQVDWFYGIGINVSRSTGIVLEDNKFSRLYTGINFIFGAHHLYRNNSSTWMKPGNYRYVISSSGATDGGGNI